MEILSLSATDLRAALPMPDAIAAMKDAFEALSSGTAHAPPRGVVPVAAHGAVTLLMGAYLEATVRGPAALTAKVVSVFPRNRDRPVTAGLAVVLDPDDGTPLALLDGTSLTAWRTGAASGAATDLLARADARIGAVIGAGGQAATQVLGIDSARRLDEIRLHSRTPARVERLIADLQPRVRARLVAAPSAAAAVRGADVVCTATSSATPVVLGSDLCDGTHLNAIGAFRLGMRELDEASVRRATVFVDSRRAALEEAGDLVAARDAGATDPAEWTELGELVARVAPGRTSPEEITLFKSVGLAVQDVIAASRALDAARRVGLGQWLRL